MATKKKTATKKHTEAEYQELFKEARDTARQLKEYKLKSMVMEQAFENEHEQGVKFANANFDLSTRVSDLKHKVSEQQEQIELLQKLEDEATRKRQELERENKDARTRYIVYREAEFLKRAEKDIKTFSTYVDAVFYKKHLETVKNKRGLKIKKVRTNRDV